jgi:hypothetical protein
VQTYSLSLPDGRTLETSIAETDFHATVYRAGKPYAWLRFTLDGWRASTLDGAEIGNGFKSPVRALRAVQRHAAEHIAALRRARVQRAALWSLYRHGVA